MPVGAEVYNRVQTSGFGKSHLQPIWSLWNTLLLVGHVFTTVLVDVEMQRIASPWCVEMVEVDGYGYVFEEIVLESDDWKWVMVTLERHQRLFW